MASQFQKENRKKNAQDVRKKSEVLLPWCLSGPSPDQLA